MEFIVGLNWGTSRGRDTYGYTTCTGNVDGKRIASCSGGGYDLRGTILADVAQQLIQADLLKLADRAPYAWDTVTKQRSDGKPKDALYGMTLYTENGKPSRILIDGGCGERSVCDIIDAAGWRYRCVDRTSRREVWTLTNVAALQAIHAATA